MNDQNPQQNQQQAPKPAPAPEKTYRQGDVLTVKDGAEVTLPDGYTITIHGTQLVLDRPGTFKVDGREVTVK